MSCLANPVNGSEAGVRGLQNTSIQRERFGHANARIAPKEIKKSCTLRAGHGNAWRRVGGISRR